MRSLIDAIRTDLGSDRVTTVHRVPCLDGIRGLAALMAALSHLSEAGYHVFPKCDLSYSGGPPVAMFFVLSSFLLSAPLLTAPCTHLKNLLVWRNYAIRRFFRIYPLFSVVLVYYATSFVLGHDSMKISQALNFVFGHLFLLRGDHIFWAVNVEFKYYFVLPVILIICVFILRKSISLAFLILILIAILTFSLSPPEGFMAVPRNLELTTYLSVFLMGLVCAMVHVRIVAAGGIQAYELRLVLEFVALAMLACLALIVPSVWRHWISPMFSPNMQPWRWYLWGLLSSILVLSQLHGVGGVRSIMAWKPIRILGLISFSLYLWHYPLIWLCRKCGFPQGTTGLAVLALVILVSVGSYLIVERPFLKLGKDLCRHASPVPGRAT